MNNYLPAIILTTTLALTACGASAETLNNRGNEAFGHQDYEAALASYQEALAESPKLAEPHYNAANVYYRQEDYDQSQHEIQQTLVKDQGKLTQNSLYNLGNTFFQKEEFETAIESYKEALRLNPSDVEAKENLELALRQLEQQQQEQQQQEQQEQQEEEQQNDQQQNGGQDEQEQEQDQHQNEQQTGQDQPDKPQESNGQQDEQQQDEGQEDEQQQGDQQQEQSEQQPEQGDQQQDQPSRGQPGDQQQEGQPGGQPQQSEGLSRDQARQLFEAATQDTESLEEHLQQILVAPGSPPAEDW